MENIKKLKYFTIALMDMHLCHLIDPPSCIK